MFGFPQTKTLVHSVDTEMYLIYISGSALAEALILGRLALHSLATHDHCYNRRLSDRGYSQNSGCSKMPGCPQMPGCSPMAGCSPMGRSKDGRPSPDGLLTYASLLTMCRSQMPDLLPTHSDFRHLHLLH